ncbi:tungstate ABC transporter substrate-binding protein WtpA [Thermosyntropha sp.]|uniref:tungstate ABC transporter substrate-binding protein WtpA n=1 Tax=Thermosyntropha sp. TaxID=2740820 RepID=UPI0025E37126|nr:tungstate ABC transporter substrate-binding protein WtpA [Thermosyntropha sp.]MBO8159715.1 tungstate ABC transporter substrate-binding protein WtpA [Thermosyntropha sp.]
MFKKNWFVAVLMLVFLIFTLGGCGADQSDKKPAENENSKDLKGELIIYHAGSLTIPFAELERKFEALHPNVDIKRTAGGSRKIARQVAELGDKVDILVSADYTVIDNLLIPDYAKWNAWFGKNSMVIMYTDNSKYADEINSDNWYEVLLRKGVNYGHSEPNIDPCGYRTVLVWQLAEKYYKQDGLFERLSNSCPANNIRPKSVELISLLESGALDYAFEYESVTRQHALKNPKFKWIELPEEINLSSVNHSEFYKNASIDLNGAEPGQIITKVGEPIVYSLTMPTTGENKELAVEFLKFFFNKEQGLKILQDNGQPVLDKVTVTGEENLSEELKPVLLK